MLVGDSHTDHTCCNILMVSIGVLARFVLMAVQHRHRWFSPALGLAHTPE